MQILYVVWQGIEKKAQEIQKYNDFPHILSHGGYDLLRHISAESPLATPRWWSGIVRREKRGDHDVLFIVLDVIHLMKIDYGWSYPGAASASCENQFSDINVGFFHCPWS